MSIELLDEPTTELTVTARAAVALSSEKTRDELKALVAKSANVKEVRNAAGREEAHSYAMALVKARTTITKTGKAAREDAAAFSKAVIVAEKELIEITAVEEARLLALRDAWDAARAAEKAEAERIERLRIETIHLRIADIRACPGIAAQCKTSGEVEALIQKLTDLSDKGFEEFAMEASVARQDALAGMREILASKKAEEDERARIKAEQEAEAARLAAERAENARVAAELERQRQEAAEAERIAAQERAEQEAKAKAARDAEEAAAKAVRQAEEQRIAQAAAELDRQRAEFHAEVDRREAEAKALAEPVKPVEVYPNGAPVYSTTTFKDNGEPIMLDPDGKRSVFCDLNDDMPMVNQADGSDDLDGPADPSDADVIACAATAVADRFGIPFNDALNRLAEIQEWIAVETT